MAASVVVDDRSRQAAVLSSLRVPLISFPASTPVSQPPTDSMPLHHHGQQQQQQQQGHQSLQPEHRHYRTQPSFGVCFDVDGVLASGTEAIPEASKAVRKLLDSRGHLRVPISFVTNSLNRSIDRANQLTEILGVQVHPDQMIQAPCPLKMFRGLHDKFCLIVGQGNIHEIASDLGFKRICTIEEVAAAYPLLDMVDHDNRRRIAKFGYQETPFQRVEAIVLMGEPKRWESALQIILDVLRTDGQPDRASDAPNSQLPVVACNMDLQFKDRAAMPRFGHGAFLVCLEALYKKLTGDDLQYTALVGKPSEITFRFAEHVLARESQRLGHSEPIKTMYLVGDTPEVDIAGCNLYQKYLDRSKDKRQTTNLDDFPESQLQELLDPHLPESRSVPSDATFCPQTIERVVPLLVCTGVYRHGTDQEPGVADGRWHHGHRDFPKNPELDKPAKICSDVDHAIDYILERENFKC